MKRIFIIFTILLFFITFLGSCGKNKETVNVTVIDGTGSGTYEVGSKVSIYAETVSGETFIAWLIDGSVVSTENPFVFVAKNNVTISADVSGRVKPVQEYNITYYYDGGEATNPATYNERTKTFSLNNPIKEGYIFDGWTYNGQDTPVKNVVIYKGTTGDKEYYAHWTKYTKPENFETLKIAVFADVQLTTSNQGATANAYISLVNHFKYCKAQNVDVIFMNGDIVNNAVASYYNYYEKALTSVYGTDESKYPEFIWNMGNHEWWDTKENNCAECLELFYQHARIDSPNLVAKSNVNYSYNYSYKLPMYYKVIKGVPFLCISGAASDGSITDAMKLELTAWLEDIQKLEYVKAGGAIYVAYHCAIENVTYGGQNSGSKSSTINDLFKDIPNAIIFTGDTHFPGGNERTINQTNFTSINIGSSSYSRMIRHSATSICEAYYNLEHSSSGKSMDIMNGEAQYLYEYAETMMIVDFNKDGSTTINRYLTNDPNNVVHVGLEWNIPLITSKSQFIYTNERFENKEWANLMYGADGLSWSKDAKVSFNVRDNQMIVYIDDVTDYNYCEHYLIEVTTDSSTNKYDFVTSYYKWDANPHRYHFLIEDVESSSTYNVKVTAYDYFDNPSLTSMVVTQTDPNTYLGDQIDLDSVKTYTDISRSINYDIKAEGSESSIEYFYKGNNDYKYGAILNRVILANSASCYKSLSATDWSNVTLKFDIKNVNNYDLYFGFSLVIYDSTGKEKWITDCGKEFQKKVAANADWTTLTWNLTDLFGITDGSKIANLSLKGYLAEGGRDTENGYSFKFYMDNLDIVETSKIGKIETTYEISGASKIFLQANHLDISVDTIDNISFLIKPTKNGELWMSIFSNNWDAAFTYLKIYDDSFVTNINGVTITQDLNGYYKVVIDSSIITTNNLAFIEFRDIWTTAEAIIKDVLVEVK